MPSRTSSNFNNTLNNNNINERAQSTDNISEISNKNRVITKKMKEIEEVIRAKLKSMWVSVRKAFLDLDDD
jgi:hypothetical protein